MRNQSQAKLEEITTNYLRILRENPNSAEEFDSFFDFFLLDELSPRDEADGRVTFTPSGMAFIEDGSGGEHHLPEDGSVGYCSSGGETDRLVENMDGPFSLLISCICWHDCCDTKQYVGSKTLEEYGQRRHSCDLEDMDRDSSRRASGMLGIPAGEALAPVLKRFRKITQCQPPYQYIFYEDDESLTKPYGLMFERGRSNHDESVWPRL